MQRPNRGSRNQIPRRNQHRVSVPAMENLDEETAIGTDGTGDRSAAGTERPEVRHSATFCHDWRTRSIAPILFGQKTCVVHRRDIALLRIRTKEPAATVTRVLGRCAGAALINPADQR